MAPKKGLFGKKRKERKEPTPEPSSSSARSSSSSQTRSQTPPNFQDQSVPPDQPIQQTAVNFTVAGHLTIDQRDRLTFLENNREIIPSRWIDTEALNDLGLTEQVQLLTQRLGLWDFLCDAVPTYRDLTLLFLATFEHNRETDIATFIMRNRRYTIYTRQLMELLGFPSNNENEMDDSCTFRRDLNQDAFKRAICGAWTTLKASQIKHPALRYIQRVLAHTLFGRGETQCNFYKPELFYLYCMLRRNAGEMQFMPHIGDHLAKHFQHVASSTKANGVISCGGIITKLASALRLNLTRDQIVPGPITLDIPTLMHMLLIGRTHDGEGYYSKGPGPVGYALPLTVDVINPLARSTWLLQNEPTIDLEEAQEQQQDNQPPHGGPSNQDLMDFMVQQFASLNQRMDLIEDDAQMAHYYANMAFTQQGGEPSERPPTPHGEQRRRRTRRTTRQGDNPPP